MSFGISDVTGRYRPTAPDGRRWPWAFGLFACLPLVLTVALVVRLSGEHQLAFDFRREYWVAGLRLLHGQDLYAWSRAQIASNTAFPYPPFAAVLFAPAALLPAPLAAAFACVACVGCLWTALAILRVRDWTVYGVTLLWGPVVAGWQSANLSLPLVLALALIWRYRDRPAVAGLAAGLSIALKPLVWPFALWLLATRRVRATLFCAATAGIASVGAIALVGFSQVHWFLKLDDAVSDGAVHTSYGVVGLCLGLGMSQTVSYLILAVVACALIGALLICARSNEQAGLMITVLLTLAASPLVWTHYLTLLIVPLAIMRPRRSIEWLLPLALWACPEAASNTFEIVIAWLVVITITARLLHGHGEPNRLTAVTNYVS